MNFPVRSLFLPAIFILLIAAASAFAQAEDAVKFFNEGQDAHEKGDYAAAVKAYEEALKLVPEFPEAEYQKASALLSLNKTADAEKALRHAIEMRADWSLPITSLGALLVEKNEFAEAETLLTKAVELDDSNFSAYAALTDLRLKTKAGADVLKTLLEKVKILTSKAKPTASIWASRAALENALGDKAAAKASLSRALAIEPNNKNALMTRAEIALAESDVAAAFNDANAVLKLAPNSILAKLLLARVYFADSKKAEAAKILDSIENPNADVTALKQKLAVNDSENIAELEKQLEKEPKNAAVLGRLCALERIPNPAKALDYCRRAAEAEPDNWNHTIGYGAALIRAEQYENAAIILKKIIAIKPDNFTAHANLAVALFRLKRHREAIAEYLWLTEKQPDLAIAYYFLAICYDTLGQYLDAMANYQQFLKLADKTQSKIEIENTELRISALQKLMKKK